MEQDYGVLIKNKFYSFKHVQNIQKDFKFMLETKKIIDTQKHRICEKT
jgi:hypothetical protein